MGEQGIYSNHLNKMACSAVYILLATVAALASGQYAVPAAPASRVGGAFTAAPRTVDGSTHTVTQRVTLDRFVTETETIYNSVPVTLTNIVLHTETLQTYAEVRTAVDDQVLVLTTEYTRPQTITVTDEVSNYNLQTSVNVVYQTILHSNYKIMQSTFTHTVYSTLTVTSAIVRTNINTEYVTETEVAQAHSTVFAQPPAPVYAPPQQAYAPPQQAYAPPQRRYAAP